MVKRYIKLTILLVAFFLFYALGFICEKAQIEPGEAYYGGYFTLSFLPSLLVFLIFYGCYSYATIKRIIVPHLLLLCFLLPYCFWMWIPSRDHNPFYNFILLALLFVGVSAVFSLLTKFICWLKHKKKDANGQG